MGETKDEVKLVFVGHVDHGKSTVIGRLLDETDSLQEGRLEAVRKACDEKGKEFEYAYLLDAFEEEQEQGITIDTTKIEFSTDERNYVIIDAPGHKEFIKNMISGAADAEAALLVVDAEEGVKEQTKKHSYLLSLLGFEEVHVLINKMDLVDYHRERFLEVKKDVDKYLEEVDLEAESHIPLSAKKGKNLTSSCDEMTWTETTFLESLNRLESSPPLDEKPLRMPIQDTYKFDNRRIVAGKVESGVIKKGDEVVILPENRTARVESIEGWKEESKEEVSSGYTAGITLDEEFYFKRGQFITYEENTPSLSNFILCKVFWMGENPLKADKEYKLKIATEEEKCEVYAIKKVIDADTLEEKSEKDSIPKNGVGEVVLKTKNPVLFDPFSEIQPTGRFVLVEDNDVCGGGIIEEQPEELSKHDKLDPEGKYITPKRSLVTREERFEKHGHEGLVVWMTGLPGCGKERVAKRLERVLFDQGRETYHISASNIRLSLSSDLDFSQNARQEHIRRLAETANLMYNAGLITIVSVVSPFRDDRFYARSIIGSENFLEVFVDAPLEVCKESNPQGIYSKAEEGSLKRVPGVNFDYEESEGEAKTLSVESSDFDVDQKVKEVLEYIDENGFGEFK